MSRARRSGAICVATCCCPGRSSTRPLGSAAAPARVLTSMGFGLSLPSRKSVGVFTLANRPGWNR